MIENTTIKASKLLFPAACLGVLLLAGCAQQPLVQTTPEEQVAVRAKARWDAVVARDWAKAYSFATPAYRQAIDLDGFKGRSAAPVIYKSAEVVSVKCEETACTATMKIGVTPVQSGFGDLSTTIDERWVLDEGQWWRYDKF